MQVKSPNALGNDQKFHNRNTFCFCKPVESLLQIRDVYIETDVLGLKLSTSLL